MYLIIGKVEQGREKSNVIKLGFWDGDTLGELLFFPGEILFSGICRREGKKFNIQLNINTCNLFILLKPFTYIYNIKHTHTHIYVYIPFIYINISSKQEHNIIYACN